MMRIGERPSVTSRRAPSTSGAFATSATTTRSLSGARAPAPWVSHAAGMNSPMRTTSPGTGTRGATAATATSPAGRATTTTGASGDTTNAYPSAMVPLVYTTGGAGAGRAMTQQRTVYGAPSAAGARFNRGATAAGSAPFGSNSSGTVPHRAASVPVAGGGPLSPFARTAPLAGGGAFSLAGGGGSDYNSPPSRRLLGGGGGTAAASGGAAAEDSLASEAAAGGNSPAGGASLKPPGSAPISQRPAAVAAAAGAGRMGAFGGPAASSTVPPPQRSSSGYGPIANRRPLFGAAATSTGGYGTGPGLRSKGAALPFAATVAAAVSPSRVPAHLLPPPKALLPTTTTTAESQAAYATPGEAAPSSSHPATPTPGGASSPGGSDPYHNHPLTIVFDLDETLVCNRGPGRAIVRPHSIETLQLLRDLRDEGYHVEVVLWTASVEDLARTVLDTRLDPEGRLFQHHIFRDSRWFREVGYTKDLRQLGRDMRRVVIVENSPMSVRLNRGNAIMVRDFLGMSFNDCDMAVVRDVLHQWVRLAAPRVRDAAVAAASPPTGDVVSSVAVAGESASANVSLDGSPPSPSKVAPSRFVPITEFLQAHPAVGTGGLVQTHGYHAAPTAKVAAAPRAGVVVGATARVSGPAATRGPGGALRVPSTAQANAARPIPRALGHHFGSNGVATATTTTAPRSATADMGFRRR